MKHLLPVLVLLFTGCIHAAPSDPLNENLSESGKFLAKYDETLAKKFSKIKPFRHPITMRNVSAAFGSDYFPVEAPFVGFGYKQGNGACIVFFFFDAERPKNKQEEDRVLEDLMTAEIRSVYYYKDEFLDGFFISPKQWRGVPLKEQLPELAKRFKLR